MKSLIIVAGILVGAVYLGFGTLAPCGILREVVRKQDGLAAVLPDGLVDAALAAQHGALSPGKCLSILAATLTSSAPAQTKSSQKNVSPQNVSAPADDPIKRAFEITQAASNECRAKRLRGEFKTYVESTECSNSQMIAAFRAANYKHIDLIGIMASRRLMVAKSLDSGYMTEEQANAEIQKAFAEVQEIERRRDSR